MKTQTQPSDLEKAKWHLKVPVCRIKSGIKTHVSLISNDDIKLLITQLNCSCDDLVDTMYKKIQAMRGRC